MLAGVKIVKFKKFKDCIKKNKMETPNIAHVTGEVIIFAGTFFYLQRQITTLTETIAKLDNTNKELENHLNDLDSQVVQIYNILTGTRSEPKPTTATIRRRVPSNTTPAPVDVS